MRHGWLVLAIALVALSTLSGCGQNEAEERLVEVTEGWQYRWGDSPRDENGRLVWLDDSTDDPAWQDMSFPGKPPGKGKRVWLRVPLPEGQWADPVFSIDPVLMMYETYLDGELVHRFGDLDEEATRYWGLAWQMVPIDRERPRVMHLRVRSQWVQTGVHGRVFIGSRADLVESLVWRDIGAIGVGFVSLVIALGGIVVAALGIERKLAVAFSSYAVATTLYSVYYTKLKDLFYDDALVWSEVHFVASQVSTIAILVFVENVIGAGPGRMIRRFWQLHAAWAVFISLFVYGYEGRSAAVEWPNLQNAMQVSLRMLIAVEVLAILFVVARSALRKSRDAIIFLVGATPAIIITGRDLLAFFGVLPFNWQSSMYVGFVALTVSLGVIVHQRYMDRLRQYATEIDRKSREKAVMLRDLHDGVGGITTNISLLADIARRAESPETTERAVSDISELSREGLAEIRSFLHSLDESEMTWERLLKELRHLGKQVLGAHGIEFSIQGEVDPDIAPPQSLIFLNVLRIFRESMTNVVKHSGAKEVRAVLEVGPTELHLRTSDDGVGPSSAPPGSGRGLGNMRARARDLGGELRIEADPGMCLDLRVPLPLTHPDLGVQIPQTEP